MKQARQYINGSIVKLWEVVLCSLNSVTTEMSKKFFWTSGNYETAYQSGCKVTEVEAAVKKV